MTMRMNVTIVAAAVIAAALLLPGRLAAQAVTQTQWVRVFLDCQGGGDFGPGGGCDREEFRTEIGFVDWVVDRAVADVHVIMTDQDTGAGTRYVLDFLGASEFEGVDAQLTHDSPNSDTRDELLRSLTDVLKAGLVTYVARRGYADQLDIQVAEPDGEEAAAAPTQDDPWNLWVFQIGGGVSADGEERQFSRRLGANVSASRTTPFWKIDIELETNVFRREVELNDGEVFVNNTDEWDLTGILVRSISDHWSVGSGFEASRSTELNRDVGGRTALALEWSLFPYDEANRRQLVVHYQLGYSRIRYDVETIFGRMEDRLGDHSLAVAFDLRQPWGSASAGVQYSNLLEDWSKYRLSLDSEVNFRIFRGLELEVEAGYNVLRDQIYLPAEDLTDEEIIVEQRELATGFEYELSFGLNYQFGSIFNNVVNNRFPWNVIDF